MRTLIVLCAGNRMINGKPLYLNIHPDGKMIAEKVVEGIFPEKYDRVVYSILKSADDYFNVSEILKKQIKTDLPVEVVIIDHPTSGPAETVFKTILKAGIEGEIVVRDSLNAINLVSPVDGNFVTSLDLNEYSEDILNIKTKSFIVENEQHQILDIIEKKLRSDVISVGLYGFKDINDFMMAYQHLNDKNYPIKKMYLSHIIAYLIGYRHQIFNCPKVSGFEDYSSDEAWAALQKKYAVCFVDLDVLTDGTDPNELEAFLFSALNGCSRSKINCIVYTAKSDCNPMKIRNAFERAGINCLDVVTGVSYSANRVMVNNISDLKNAIMGV